MHERDTHKDFLSSFKEEVKQIKKSMDFCIEDFLTATYAILLANYLNEDEIFIARYYKYEGHFQEHIIKINIDFGLTLSDLIKNVTKNAIIGCQPLPKNLNASIVFSDKATLKNDLFSSLRKSKEELSKNLTFEVNISNFDQKIIYNPVMYSENDIIALDGHIKKIISTFIQNPNIPLKELSILTQAEWNKIILEWNSTNAYYPKDKSIPELFKEIVDKYPDSIALNFKGKKLTYRDLDQLSSNLARYLTNHVPPAKGKIIGIYMERSLEIIISLLGVLKSGLAYLPIHLHFPAERIRMVLEDAEVETLLTHKKLFPKLEGITDVNIVPVDTILKNNYTGPESLGKIQSNDLAYIIYTSGTTGKPKGTKISHKGVCNLITHVKNDFGVNHKTQVLQFASLSFDASVYEWAGGLLNGGELFILAEDELPPRADLAQFMRENKINFALLPPPILETIDSNNLDELHTLVSGGEACTKSIVDKWAEGRKLFNAYGPSEATVACSFSLCSPKKRITIGKPIQNVKLYILNGYSQPTPIGVPGELCIGGVGLAQGYLNRDDLTEKAFIKNPFSKSKTDRIYKTGDRARWLENGEIEYIDRIDTQVKIEGYRIELSEIEEVLNHFPEIESSYVIAHKIDEVHKQLIAFYILRKGVKELDNELLNAFLSKTLPKYMIPARYIKISSFPLTLTNKVDHKALIKIYEGLSNKISSENNNAEIGSILELTWRELLNCENVNGNFFSLGGDSIRAIQCVAILRKYGYHITSKILYEHPTIKELAHFLKNKAKPQIISNHRHSVAQGEIALSPVQQWFFEHKFKNYNAWNQAFLFKTKEPIESEYFRKAWDILINHHDEFRLRYDLKNGKVKQYYRVNKDVNFYIFQEFNIPKNKDAEWITKECLKLQNSLNIEKGPVLAIGIFNNHTDGQQRVLLAIHHLIVDGVSWRILLEDLFSVYNQLLQSQEAKLPVKSDSYGTWIEALSEYAQNEKTKSQISYWNNITQKIDKEKNIQKNQIKDQNHYALTLSKGITSGLLQDLPTYYPLQINDILLAGLAYALHEESKDYEYIVDLEGHGREECIEGVDVTRTLGWFTTIFPVLLKIPTTFQKSKESSWGNLLLEIKNELRQIPDKGIGYGALKYLGKENTKNQLIHANSLILFNYLGQFDLGSQYQATWSFASESPGNPIGTDYFGKENYSRYPLEINAVAIQGSLSINFNYNKYSYSEGQIKQLANNYRTALEQFVMLGKQLALGDLYLMSEIPQKSLTFENLNKNVEQEPYKPFSLVNVVDYKNVLEDLSLIEDIYPASCFQQRMLIEADQDPNGTYHIISNYAINYKLDKNKLISLFNDLTKKHELLRASFVKNNDGKYSVLVYKSIQTEFHFYENQDNKELIDREKLYYFNYSKPGLFRLFVNNKGSTFDLIFSIHNAIEDGWSMATLVNEFSQAYMNNKPIKTPLKVRYGEYVRNELSAIQNQENTDFWKQYLSDVKPLRVNLKSDYDKSANSLFGSFFPLNTEDVSSIHEISKEFKITVDNIFLLAYLKTLSDFMKTSDITIGISTHNRLEKEDGDKLFGSFINIIPFRFDLKKYSIELDRLIEIFNNKMTLQKYKNLPYDYIKSLYSKELYKFAFDFVHMHNLSDRAEGITSVEGYERTHIPFTLTVVQKGEAAFILSISAHNDFVDRSFLNDFTQSLKKNLSKIISSIQREMVNPNQVKAVNQ